MSIQPTPTEKISLQELSNVLEPLIRKIVREELAQITIRRPDVFYLKPDSPLRSDMEEILNRHRQGVTRMYARAEVWHE